MAGSFTRNGSRARARGSARAGSMAVTQRLSVRRAGIQTAQHAPQRAKLDLFEKVSVDQIREVVSKLIDVYDGTTIDPQILRLDQHKSRANLDRQIGLLFTRIEQEPHEQLHWEVVDELWAKSATSSYASQLLVKCTMPQVELVLIEQTARVLATQGAALANVERSRAVETLNRHFRAHRLFGKAADFMLYMARRPPPASVSAQFDARSISPDFSITSRLEFFGQCDGSLKQSFRTEARGPAAAVDANVLRTHFEMAKIQVSLFCTVTFYANPLSQFDTLPLTYFLRSSSICTPTFTRAPCRRLRTSSPRSTRRGASFLWRSKCSSLRWTARTANTQPLRALHRARRNRACVPHVHSRTRRRSLPPAFAPYSPPSLLRSPSSSLLLSSSGIPILQPNSADNLLVELENWRDQLEQIPGLARMDNSDWFKSKVCELIAELQKAPNHSQNLKWMAFFVRRNVGFAHRAGAIMNGVRVAHRAYVLHSLQYMLLSDDALKEQAKWWGNVSRALRRRDRCRCRPSTLHRRRCL